MDRLDQRDLLDLLEPLVREDPREGRVRLGARSREAFSGPEWRRRVTYVAAEPGWWAERVAAHFQDWSAAMVLAERLLLPAEIGDWSIRRLSTGELVSLIRQGGATADSRDR